jgi:hypothetical protein
MAVTVTQIDGQNTGLRLLAQTSVVPLTLDLTTGEVTSDYLTSGDCAILRQYALNLFQVVPKSARPAAAVGLLSRLCAVSPADASTITLTATVSLGVASLIATVASSPASLILTIPFSMAGGVMPGMPSSGTPTPPTPGADSNLVEVILGDSLVPGQPIAMVSGLARLARADDPALVPCVGIIDSLVNEGVAVVRVAGISSAVSGLSEGRVHFLSSTGTVVATPPTTPGHYVQALGFAISSSTFAVAPSTALSVR